MSSDFSIRTMSDTHSNSADLPSDVDALADMMDDSMRFETDALGEDPMQCDIPEEPVHFCRDVYSSLTNDTNICEYDPYYIQVLKLDVLNKKSHTDRMFQIAAGINAIWNIKKEMMFSVLPQNEAEKAKEKCRRIKEETEAILKQTGNCFLERLILVILADLTDEWVCKNNYGKYLCENETLYLFYNINPANLVANKLFYAYVASKVCDSYSCWVAQIYSILMLSRIYSTIVFPYHLQLKKFSSMDTSRLTPDEILIHGRLIDALKKQNKNTMAELYRKLVTMYLTPDQKLSLAACGVNLKR